MKKQNTKTRLIVAASENDADMLYATRLSALLPLAAGNSAAHEGKLSGPLIDALPYSRRRPNLR